MWWSIWWIWVVAGFLIGVLEVVVPGYIFLGFAIGAVMTGIFLGLDILSGGPAFLFLTFALCSLVAWVALRRTMGVRRGQVKVWDRDINDN
ncbi:MAG: hypothetical protein H9533_17620 [Rhodobacteraceae bacterium]|nr:hypothetical protein [Paracoccaceae bacterium]MCZ8336530.1 hypothetical protein [Paracoccaceae bacterium]